MADPSPGVWVRRDVRIGPSGISGDGLFATAEIATGTTVLRLGGHFASSSELAELIARANADPDVPYVDTISVDEDRHLVLPPATPVHFGNHSCDPNLWHDGPYDIVARRDIRAGEELTIDYGTNSALSEFRMTCHCGSSSCRGEVSGDDWRWRELQDRYRGHWVPVLEARISSQGAAGGRP